MGLGRFVKHMILPSTYGLDMAKNMIDEGNVVKGYKKTIKQDITPELFTE